jgi:hypothetical protein
MPLHGILVIQDGQPDIMRAGQETAQEPPSVVGDSPLQSLADNVQLLDID